MTTSKRKLAYQRRYYEQHKTERHAAAKKWREANRDYVREYNHRYRQQNKDRRREISRRYYLKYGDKVRAAANARYWNNPSDFRWSKLRRYYGLSKEDYSAFLVAQNSICPICQCFLDKDVVVDHDHATGRVRGLLHNKCNVLLGLIEDRPEFYLQNASRYLSSPRTEVSA